MASSISLDAIEAAPDEASSPPRWGSRLKDNTDDDDDLSSIALSHSPQPNYNILHFDSPSLLDVAAATTSTSSSSSSSSSSCPLNQLDEHNSNEQRATQSPVIDIQSIALLKQIFPEDTTEELRAMHRERVTSGMEQQYKNSLETRTTSILGERIRQLMRKQGSSPLPDEAVLPADFLRLPTDVAVRRQRDDGKWEYKLIAQMEARTLKHFRCFVNKPDQQQQQQQQLFSKVLHHDSIVGLGMNLKEERGNVVRIHSLKTGRDESGQERIGPAADAGLVPGDVLVGINGQAFLETLPIATTNQQQKTVGPRLLPLLSHVAELLRQSPIPVVVHVLRSVTTNGQQQLLEPPTVISTQSLLDATNLTAETSFLEETVPSMEVCFESPTLFPSTPFQRNVDRNSAAHPLVSVLLSHNLVKSTREIASTARLLHQYMLRAQQWEETGAFTTAPTTYEPSSLFIPLTGVRKALSVRIVNAYEENEATTAYTIWIYDVHAGKEWYAPIRYDKDFQDLRAAILQLLPGNNWVSNLPFPRTSLLSSLFSPSKKKAESMSERCQQLEQFLRSLAVILYRAETLNPAMAEVALHVQSFVGCHSDSDNALDANDASFLSTEVPPIVATSSPLRPSTSVADTATTRLRLGLKRGIQQYVFRIFLLPVIGNLIDSFVTLVRAQTPQFHDIESLEAKGTEVLKERALKSLSQVQSFLDQLLELMLKGCLRDFVLLAERPEFDGLRYMLRGVETSTKNSSNSWWERLVREAVREQIEIEVYVPLRTAVSRWLVSGWRHEGEILLVIHFAK